MNYILFNEKSHNGDQLENMKKLEVKLVSFEKINVINLDYPEFFKTLTKDDKVILFGGDGTLNHFVNDVKNLTLPCDFLFYSSGTGNDFRNDMDAKTYDDLIFLNDMVYNLPTCTVNGKDYKFINGVGFGIDGYCCEVADDLQAKSDKPVNYTSIAIKGLLFKFKRRSCKVTVDGEVKEYKNAWIAPTMLGVYYGGGMKIAPNQDRFNEDKTLTSVVMHHRSRIKTLIVFSKVFEGKHVNYPKMVDMRVGHEITVEFSIPTPLQIDGETIRNVTKYTVRY